MYILALDQGTTSSRALLIDHEGTIVSQKSVTIQQYFPQPGWVEHDPEELYQSLVEAAKQCLSVKKVTPKDIAAIGITNQRETTILWEKKTLIPVEKAIVWQDRRTTSFCKELKEKGLEELITKKTGLILDPYFSATKLNWLLQKEERLEQLAKKGELAFGTVDCWIAAKLSQGECHTTDPSNASRTMLYNIHTKSWDDELLEIFAIPKGLLPEISPSSAVFGQCKEKFAEGVPLAAMIGDQQAALFGQDCFSPGMIKTTYGTGAFVLMNSGDTPIFSQHRLLSSVGWERNEKTTYVLEGSVFNAGSVINWLQENLQLVDDLSQIDRMAFAVKDDGGVYFVPAFTGLGAPHWIPEVRAAIFGLTRATKKEHIIRAALAATAFQVKEVIDTMVQDSNLAIQNLTVDGGLTASDFLLQFQSDILQKNLVRPKAKELTALGAGFLGGLAVGFWKDLQEIAALREVDKEFHPSLSQEEVEKQIAAWNHAVKCTKLWSAQ